jgi:tetratricopeptide (TPR) repeat protein
MADALAILAVRLRAQVINLVSDDPITELRGADELTARALGLDPNDYLTHYARALFLAVDRPDESIVEAERALALNPSFLPTYIALSSASLSAGRALKAVEYADTALRLSPRDPLSYAFLMDKLAPSRSGGSLQRVSRRQPRTRSEPCYASGFARASGPSGGRP